ncbi:MAG: homocysteine S-methyltransferase family protein [Candidatus Hodarchaeota archaeon]
MDFLSLLEEKKVLLFDGSLGTELMRRGLKKGTLPDIWNLEKPDIIKDVFKQYFLAGSDIVQTATFQANGIALKKHGIDAIDELNKASAEILRSICPENACIIGDIGPSGEFLPPVGNASVNELKYGYKMQVRALEDYIDAYHLETFSDLQEMTIAINAVKNESKKPIIASMTYKKTPRGFFTIMGNSLTECINKSIELGVSVIGSNCTMGSKEFIELAKGIRDITSNFPISIKPNAGQPELINGIPVYKQKPEDFAEDFKEILECGVQIIGGCCGTGPSHIRLLRKELDNYIQRR